MTYYDKVKEAAEAVRARVSDVPSIAIVLGSGLGDFANSLGDAVSIPYVDIPHWPTSNVIGHAGTLVAGTAKGRRILALSGRSHAYEGHDLRTVTFAVRALGLLGVKTLILTNAAGGINVTLKPGTLMVMDDHINPRQQPALGPNEDRRRRFPDMPRCTRSACGSRTTWREQERRRPDSRRSGPSYETPAEIRYLRHRRRRRRHVDRARSRVARHMGDVSASRASRTWRRACCPSRSITMKETRAPVRGHSPRCWRERH